MRKQDIISGATEYATYITNHIPQKSQDNKILYYFSGSLAMLLLSSAKNIAFVEADKNGDINFISPQVKVTPEAKNAFKKGVRPISIDVDVVTVNDSALTNKGKYYNIAKVKENCHLATELCPAWSRIGGTMYFDILSDERDIISHNMTVIELENSNPVFIVNPIDLMLHKLSESLHLQTKPKQAEKYEKDVKDLACLLGGIISLDILPENFEEYIGEVLNNNPTSSISKNLVVNHETELLNLAKDIKPYIDKQIYDKAKQVLSVITKFNKEKSDPQLQ